MIGVPLQGKGERVIGALNCFTSAPHEFSRTDINLLTAVANQAAVAIINTELIIKTRIIQEELSRARRSSVPRRSSWSAARSAATRPTGGSRKRSMDSRKSLLEVAEAILLANEILLTRNKPHFFVDRILKFH